MDPLVSIVIPVYNGSNYLSEAIDSALAQTYSNIEIIVVNDGSNDDGATWKIAHSYGDKIRYFEKPNGGVSTALNFGIANMRGKYFSWLSHDDLYYPNKIQTEIDALRKSGDMTRIVYSNWASMVMPERKIIEYTGTRIYRQEFLETGAFSTIFQFISGCSLLIPKIYFDVYGGFDENYRAVQDYKKWFEMFRGRRLIYLRDTLIISRNHPQQTGKTYSKVREEELWLYDWLVKSVEADDLVGSGLTDMYHFYSAAFTKFSISIFADATKYSLQKLRELPESPDSEERRLKFLNFLNQAEYDTYFFKEHEQIIKQTFVLRGITPDASKFIPISQVPAIKSDKKIRFFDFRSLMQLLIDTPVKKSIIENIRLEVAKR